jgi:hypothetical protein
MCSMVTPSGSSTIDIAATPYCSYPA